jgi:hypothetical protein
MKALIIYDDFAAAVRANVALQNSARNADFAVQWKVNPWQIDMLKFSLTAEEALTEALDAHLIVIASRSAKSSTFWFQGWLEHWAKCRQIEGAALALFGVGYSDGLAASVIREFSSIARRHGLSLIIDGGRSGKDQSNFIEHSLDGQKLSSKPIMPIPHEQVRQAYSCWGINE